MCDVGTKNVAKELEITTQGRVRDTNVTCFPELVDSIGDVAEDDNEDANEYDNDYDDNVVILMMILMMKRTEMYELVVVCLSIKS